MKKYLFASMLAACVLMAATAQDKNRPAPVTITGTVKASDSNAVLITADGKEYAIFTMDRGRENRPDGEPRPTPPGDKVPDGQPPKMVTKEEVMALDGKKVSVTGFIPNADDGRRNASKDAPKDAPKFLKDGALMITSYEIK